MFTLMPWLRKTQTPAPVLFYLSFGSALDMPLKKQKIILDYKVLKMINNIQKLIVKKYWQINQKYKKITKTTLRTIPPLHQQVNVEFVGILEIA